MMKPNLIPYFIKTSRFLVLFACASLSSQAAVPSSEIPIPQDSESDSNSVSLGFTRKYGTASNDTTTGISVDSLGNIYLAGNTEDSVSSGFIRKYSPVGGLLWDRKKPSNSINGITHDKNGDIYIVGSYISEVSSPARHYVYLEKYDSEGNILWTKSIVAAKANDPTGMIANGIATDSSGNNFIVILYEKAFWPYQTREVHIRKYNVSGSPIWDKIVGSSSPYTARPSLATDTQGKIYTAINSAANQRWNASIRKFDGKGDSLWTTTLFPSATSSESYIHGITADTNSNVFVTGITKASLDGENLGNFDAFVRKYDHASAALWTKQFGTNASDYANSLTTDSEGNVYVAGSSAGDLNGPNRGSFDAIIRKFNGKGDTLKTKQFGSLGFDIANGIKTDTNGNLFVAGQTTGSLGGPNAGAEDVYIRKYTAFR